MPYSREKYQEVGAATAARMAKLSPEERKALTAPANEARSRKARERRHAAWAAEMRAYGWEITPPMAGWNSGPCPDGGKQGDTEPS